MFNLGYLRCIGGTGADSFLFALRFITSKIVQIIQDHGLNLLVRNIHHILLQFFKRSEFLRRFHPCTQILLNNDAGNIDMSPNATNFFSTCRFIQNIQSFHYINGVNKDIYKYCVKLYQQNYVVVKSNAYHAGNSTTRS